jgi:metallo-beta-lactamase family protein
VILPGFQVAGTRGRALLDSATSLKMFGGYVPVRAEVVGVDGFSAHADADGLLAWLRASPSVPQTTFVVDGDETASMALARRIGAELGWRAVVPSPASKSWSMGVWGLRCERLALGPDPVPHFR